MEAPKFAKCPTCGYENLPGTLLCVRCYSLIEQPSGVFPPTDVPPTGMLGNQANLQLPNSQTEDEHQHLVGQLDPDSIALVVSDSNESLIVQVVTQAVLGRYTPNNPMQPLVDLTSYGALERGVSRMHVIIRRTTTGVLIIEDMASSNGTSLNDLRLAPYAPAVIRSGDRLRLGKLELEIYFNEGL